MSLALSYRPDSFDEMVGNSKLVDSVKIILKRNKEDIPKSWLFTGPSGCGKTTLARIVSKTLGCVGSDLYELDSADFRGIDTVRNIRQQMQYAPMKGNCRIWILDECHQITKDAQEALLKALEDTPPHVFFILATTEPQKLKNTLKNRCVSFEVEPVQGKDMVEFLKEVVVCEEKKCDKDVLETIAINALGSCRAALQLLETVIDLSPAKMREGVKQAAEKQSAVIDLCRALFKGDSWKKVASIFKRLEGEQPETIRLAVMGYCSSVLLNAPESAQSYLVMDSFKEPLFHNGRAGLILMAYEALEAGKL